MKKNAVLILILGYSVITYGQRLSSEMIKPICHDTLIKYMQQTLHDLAIPGIAVSIFTKDKVLNEEVSGVRRLHTNDSIKLNDRFHLGSCGKAMTGFVAARLVEKGLIMWNTKVFDVFPELKDSSNIVYRNVTLYELLSHRSKVRPFTSEDEELAKFTDFKGKDILQRRYNFSKWLLKQGPIDLDSVKEYTYSNAGFAIAASMMEKVTGMQWENLINEELFKPLKIHISFGWPALEDKNQPWGHWIKEGESMLIPHSPNDYYKLDDIITPAGNYSMSIIDYTKFLQLNLLGINGKDTILKSSTYGYLHYCNFNPNRPLEYWNSIGWFVNRTPEPYTISVHNGSAGTFYCFALLVKELNFGLVIITNAGYKYSEIGIEALKNKIIEYYRRK